MGKCIGWVLLVLLALAPACSDNKKEPSASETKAEVEAVASDADESPQTVATKEKAEEETTPEPKEGEDSAKKEKVAKPPSPRVKAASEDSEKGAVKRKAPQGKTPKREGAKKSVKGNEKPNEEAAMKRAALLAAGSSTAGSATIREKAVAPNIAQTKQGRDPVNVAAEAFAKPPLPISHALSSQELKQLTGQTFKPSSLGGQLPSPAYNSLYFRTTREEKLGVVVQLWHEPALKDTRARYEAMKIGYPNAQETGNITNYTFFSHWGNVYHMVFMDLKRRRVAAVSTEALTPNQLFTVATRVRDRLLR